MLVLPVSLFIAGCDSRQSASNDTGYTTATNAAMSAADNSGKNVRDKDGGTLTPPDQGGTPADLQVTEKIRQAVVSGTNNISMTGRNIKIMTVNGKVTLRGPVKNSAEKTSIVAAAKAVAGESNVDDQLEVVANP